MTHRSNLQEIMDIQTLDMLAHCNIYPQIIGVNSLTTCI
jgi:hypothetical protein